MPRVAVDDNKRMNLRVRPEQKATLMRAAALKNTDLTDFVLQPALREAEAKLLLSPQAVPAGHSLLFAVGAWPPHDGVRKARRLNLSRDLRGIAALRLRTLNEITLPIVPTGTTSAPPSSGGNGNASCHAAAAFGQGCLPQRNSAPSLHIRCRITASLRATATRALAMPRRLATCMPQARSADHLVPRVSSECAAS